MGDDWRPFVIYYKNAKEGLIIEATACDKQVIKLFYLPAPKSDLPICTEDWNYDPASPVKIDKYSDVPITEEQKRLDRLAAALRESPGWDGYIVS